MAVLNSNLQTWFAKVTLTAGLMGLVTGLYGDISLTVPFLDNNRSIAQVPPVPQTPISNNFCGGIGRDIRVASVQIPSPDGMLAAKIYAPDESLQTAPCPLISMLPGGGAGIESVEWAATRLAANGYVVIITKPINGTSTLSYNTAVKSGIDFMLSAANPFVASTHDTAIGAAGWSLGGRTLTRTQREDLRIQAIVAWDNLAVRESGDDGSPVCTFTGSNYETPRVPAMGQASETCSGSEDLKKTAFNWWRQNGVPSFVAVFSGWNHFGWGQKASNSAYDLSHYFTIAWFDRWLKNDLAATNRLLAPTPNYSTSSGMPKLSTVLSTKYNSAAFLDGYDCHSLQESCSK